MTQVRIVHLLSRAACAVATVALIAILSSGTMRSSFALVFYRTLSRIISPDVVLIGDSLSQNCSWYSVGSRPFSTINLARGGVVTREVLGQSNDALRMNPRVIVIAVGTNDLLLDHAPISRIAFDFVILMRAVSSIPIKIVTLIPYTSDASANRLHVDANEVIKRTALEYGAHIVDLNPLIADNGILKQSMTSDGIHLNDSACDIWRKEVSKALKAPD